MEPFCVNDALIGFVGYFPMRGMLESKSGSFIKIEYLRSIVVTDADQPDHEAMILERSLAGFSTYFPVKYVVDTVNFDILESNLTPIFSKFHFELFHMIPHMKHTLKIQKEKIHFCDIESLPSLLHPTFHSVPITHLDHEPSPIIEKIIQEEVKIAEMKETIHSLPPLAPPPPPKVKTMWDYHGYETTPPKPTPWEAFGSHLESEEDGGYCRGQWDGHLNEKTIAQGIPYGIVDTHGNRDKIQDILSCKLVTKENPLYGLFVDLLNANNSIERVQCVKKYLDDRNLTYNDESFWIKAEGKPPVKRTFFKAVILPLTHQTPQFLHYMKKKESSHS